VTSASHEALFVYTPDSGIQLLARKGGLLQVAPGDFRTLSFCGRADDDASPTAPVAAPNTATRSAIRIAGDADQIAFDFRPHHRRQRRPKLHLRNRADAIAELARVDCQEPEKPKRLLGRAQRRRRGSDAATRWNSASGRLPRRVDLLLESSCASAKRRRCRGGGVLGMVILAELRFKIG